MVDLLLFYIQEKDKGILFGLNFKSLLILLRASCWRFPQWVKWVNRSMLFEIVYWNGEFFISMVTPVFLFSPIIVSSFPGIQGPYFGQFRRGPFQFQNIYEAVCFLPGKDKHWDGCYIFVAYVLDWEWDFLHLRARGKWIFAFIN